ncbi:plasmid recombination protein, partial [Proteus mirabilis]|uniref:plasmid recombination protein n=1 Tax=Proteus mirabilis TaxID=584 RepID=UPI00298C085F
MDHQGTVAYNRREVAGDAVLAVEYVMTASPEWWAKATPQQQAAFFDQAQGWLAAKYGADRIVTAS